VAIVDSATATASALVELLAINGLEAPGTTASAATSAGAAFSADAGAAGGDGRDRPDETPVPAVHVQLTTGDVDAFRVVAERIFGEAFPDVGSVEVSAVAR
jgi:hypothetical protein